MGYTPTRMILCVLSKEESYKRYTITFCFASKETIVNLAFATKHKEIFDSYEIGENYEVDLNKKVI